MLVTFKTNAYSDITMFGTAAVALLKLMGQSGNVPGAIMADEVPDALAKLTEALDRIGTNAPEEQQNSAPASGFDDEDEEPVIGLDTRAGPLLSLLEAAIAAKENVVWNA